MKDENYVIGIDFGTDSVRIIIVDSFDGTEISGAFAYYPRWMDEKYCDPVRNQFRQHPLDYIESMQTAVKKALSNAPDGAAEKTRGISIDTTASTPVAVTKDGLPLSLIPEFKDNTNAMFILWKDHTAINEADEINNLAHTREGIDYTQYSGGIYSSEWFWSKILHAVRIDEDVRNAAFSWVEHCDWIPALLTGNTDALKIKRSR